MVLDVFEYFWNVYRDFFRKNDCIDDYTRVLLTEDNILHFETNISKNSSLESVIEGFDNIVKELLGYVDRLGIKLVEDESIVEIEYTITEGMKSSIYMLSKVYGYDVFETEL